MSPAKCNHTQSKLPLSEPDAYSKSSQRVLVKCVCVKGFSGRGSRNRHKNVDSKHSKKQLCINVTLCLIVTELCNKCLSIWNRELLNELSKQTNILHNMTQQVYIVYIKHDSTASSKFQVPQKSIHNTSILQICSHISVTTTTGRSATKKIAQRRSTTRGRMDLSRGPILHPGRKKYQSLSFFLVSSYVNLFTYLWSDQFISIFHWAYLYQSQRNILRMW